MYCVSVSTTSHCQVPTLGVNVHCPSCFCQCPFTQKTASIVVDNFNLPSYMVKQGYGETLQQLDTDGWH